jgi:hypothetical protein
MATPTPTPPAVEARRAILAVSGLLGLAVVAVALLRVLLAPQWDEEVLPLVEFVESARGLEFEEPVRIERIDVNAALVEGNDGHWQEDATSFDPTLHAYALLGLIDPPGTEANVARATQATAAGLADGFYDHHDKTIYINSEMPETLVPMLLVHELVHALQDQHGLLDAWSASTETQSVLVALVEGDARRIENIYWESLTESEREAYRATAQTGEWVDRPNTFFEASFTASYVLGPPAVEAIVDEGGPEALDRMLRNGHVGSAERLVDPFGPSMYPSLHAQQQMASLAAQGFSPARSIGALNWYRALAPRLGTEGALAAVIGYDDDAYRIVETDGANCVEFVLLFDNADEGAEFLELVAGVGLAARYSDPTEARPPILMEVCEPIGSPDDQRHGTVSPLFQSSNLAVAHLEAGLSREVARCAAHAQAGSLSASLPATEGPSFDDLLRDSAPWIATCQATSADR